MKALILFLASTMLFTNATIAKSKEPVEIKTEIKVEEQIDVLLQSPEKLVLHVTKVAQEAFKDFLLKEKGMSFPEIESTFDDIVLGTLKSQGKKRLVRKYKQTLHKIIEKAKEDQILYKQFQNYQVDNMVRNKIKSDFLLPHVEKTDFTKSTFNNKNSEESVKVE